VIVHLRGVPHRVSMDWHGLVRWYALVAAIVMMGVAK
jgi:hypothetical protein